MRLPPPAIRCPASSGMSATLLCMRSRITALTPFMSAATSPISGSSDGACWVFSGRTVAVTAPALKRWLVPRQEAVICECSGAIQHRLDCLVAGLLTMAMKALPNMDALVRGEVELVARLHVECLVPGVDVPNDAVHPILAGAVLVGDDLLPLGVLALLLLPGLRPGDEEALVAGQPVNYRRLAVLGDVLLVRRIGRLDTRQVADVLAQRQLSVQVQIGPRVEMVILRYE